MKNTPFNWKKRALLGLLFALSIVCVAASIWQFTRAQQVDSLRASIQENGTRKPMTMAQFWEEYHAKKNDDEKRAMHMMPVQLVGKVVGMPIALDNKMHTTKHGRERGYDVLRLIQTTHGYLLLDVGWIAVRGTQTLSALSADAGTIGSDGLVNMTTHLDALAKAQFILQDDVAQPTDAPVLLQTLNFSLLSTMFQTHILPVLFRMDADYIASPLVERQKKLTLSPAKNYGYAAQWLCFALIALVGMGVLYCRH